VAITELVQTGFDVVVAGGVLALAWLTLSSRDLLKASIIFVAFGLFMSLAWVRLGAPDVALAEAAIGAGITGTLLVAAVARLRQAGLTDPENNPAPGPEDSNDGDEKQ